jgi:hypothetical protein
MTHSQLLNGDRVPFGNLDDLGSAADSEKIADHAIIFYGNPCRSHHLVALCSNIVEHGTTMEFFVVALDTLQA